MAIGDQPDFPFILPILTVIALVSFQNPTDGERPPIFTFNEWFPTRMHLPMVLLATNPTIDLARPFTHRRTQTLTIGLRFPARSLARPASEPSRSKHTWRTHDQSLPLSDWPIQMPSIEPLLTLFRPLRTSALCLTRSRALRHWMEWVHPAIDEFPVR